MISHLAGTVTAIAPEGAVIEVGGVGLLVQCTPGTLATLRHGEPARVATSLVVREDALTLFGFTTDDERDVFVLLQTASGVGPRLALAMLAVFTPDALRRAVLSEDVAALTRVPGIGQKGCPTHRPRTRGPPRRAWLGEPRSRGRRGGGRPGGPGAGGSRSDRAGQPGLAGSRRRPCHRGGGGRPGGAVCHDGPPRTARLMPQRLPRARMRRRCCAPRCGNSSRA